MVGIYIFCLFDMKVYGVIWLNCSFGRPHAYVVFVASTDYILVSCFGSYQEFP